MPMLGQFDPMQLQMMMQAQQDPYVAELIKRMMAPPPEKPKPETKGQKARKYIGGALAGLGDALAARASVMGRTSLPTNTLQMLMERRMMQQRQEQQDYQKALQEQETGKRQAAGELYRIRTAKQAQPQKTTYEEREATVAGLKARGAQISPEQEYRFIASGKWPGDEDPMEAMGKAARLGEAGVVPPSLSPELQAIAKQAMEFADKKAAASRSASTAEGKVGGMTMGQVVTALRLNYNNLLTEMGVPLRRTTVTTYDENMLPKTSEVMVPVPDQEQRVKAKKAALNRLPKVVREFVLREMPDWAEQLDENAPPAGSAAAAESDLEGR